MQPFTCSLDDLGLKVSTGRVVDFRAKEFLQNELTKDSAPLIYPHNLQKGIVEYPVAHKKKFDIWIAPETESLLVATGTYVLVKRFSAKEEKNESPPRYLNVKTFQAIKSVLKIIWIIFMRMGRALIVNSLEVLLSIWIQQCSTGFDAFQGERKSSPTDRTKC